MAMDIVTAVQGSTCAVTQTECCVFTLDESVNVSSILHEGTSECPELSDATPIPQPRELINQCFGLWGSWWEEMLLNLGILTLTCVFSCTCLYCFCGICL